MATTKIIRDGIYLTFGSILAFIFSYLFRMVLTRYLSVSEYGLFYSIWNFLTFFLFFLYMGLDQAVVHYIVKYKASEEYDKIKTAVISTLFFQLITTAIFVILIFVFSSYLEANYFRFPQSGYFLKLMSLFLIFNVLGGISTYVLYGFQRMRVYSFYAPVQSFLYLALALIFLKFNLGLYAPFLAYLATSVLLVLFFLPFSFKSFPLFKYKMVEFKGITRTLFSYGFPVILTAISSRLLIQTDTLMLTRMTSLEQVGLYQTALPLATLLTFFSAGILTIIFPLFTELWHNNDKSKIEMYLKYIYKYLTLLMLPAVALLIIFSKSLLGIMFGQEYLAASTAMIILSLSVIFNILSSINLQSISAFGHPKDVSKIVLFGAIFNIVLNFILIPLFGINGAALATSLSYLLIFVLSWNRLRKYIIIQFEKRWPWFSWAELKKLKELILMKSK